MLPSRNHQTFKSIIQAIFTPKRSFATEPTKDIRRKWTTEESIKLLELVRIHGNKWTVVQQHFSDRGTKGVASRYRSLMSKLSSDLKAKMHQGVEEVPTNQKWTEEENQDLLNLVDEHGPQWTKICEQFKRRTLTNVKHQYTKLNEAKLNYLREEAKLRRNGPWSEQEKHQYNSLINVYGRDFTTIASMMKTRSEKQCRGRYSHLANKPATLADLKPNQLDNLKKAAAEYGLDDINLLIQKANLPFNLSEWEIRKYYRQELDPKIVRSTWTQVETITMIRLLEELDGCMELVQPRLPVKRSLKDMWAHYKEYRDTQSIAD